MSGNIQPGGSVGVGGLTGAAGGLQGLGGQLAQLGQGQLGQAGGYFSKLAGGNRATLTQALAPDIENINSVYGGSARTMSRFLRGPTRDTQMAESERDRANQLGSLFRNARPQANQALAGMGSAATGQGVSAMGGAGGLFGSAAQLGQGAGIASAELGQQAGVGFGGLLFNLLKQYGPMIAGGALAGPAGAGAGSIIGHA